MWRVSCCIWLRAQPSHGSMSLTKISQRFRSTKAVSSWIAHSMLEWASLTSQSTWCMTSTTSRWRFRMKRAASSFMEIYTEDRCNDMVRCSGLCNTSDYPKDHPLYSMVNKKAVFVIWIVTSSLAVAKRRPLRWNWSSSVVLRSSHRAYLLARNSPKHVGKGQVICKHRHFGMSLAPWYCCELFASSHIWLACMPCENCWFGIILTFWILGL